MLTNPQFLQQWINEIKNFLINHRTAFQIINNYKIKKAKTNFINRRFSFLQHNKRAMINSILDQPKKKILLNKIIIKEPHLQVITDPTQIQLITKQHFQQWTAKHKTCPLSNFPEWLEEYKPQQHISEQWYNPLETPFTTSEIFAVIQNRSNKSAPGLSTIPYIAWSYNTSIYYFNV